MEPTLARMLARENLRAAWLAVKANGGAPGVEGMEVKDKVLKQLIGRYLKAPMQSADGSRQKRDLGTP